MFEHVSITDVAVLVLMVIIFVVPLGVILLAPDLIEKYLLRGQSGQVLTKRLRIALALYVVLFVLLGVGGGYYVRSCCNASWTETLVMVLAAAVPVAVTMWRLVHHMHRTDS